MAGDGRVLFVTGRLAEPSLRRVLDAAPPPVAWDVAVMKITVAALMTTDWIGRFLKVPAGTARVMIPGLCEGDAAALADRLGVPVDKGPDDLRDLPAYWGHAADAQAYGAWDIEILAEINHAPRLSRADLLRQAAYFRESGADVVDLGCTPGLPFPDLAGAVRALVDAGSRVSIDTFDPAEIRTAVEAGAEMVLSVNAANRDVIADMAGSPARVVAVPEPGGGLETLDPTLDALTRHGVSYLIDPVLAPIGHGFMASLERYAEVRRRHPDAEMLMGIGNLTELTAADSTGVNALLTAICQELRIRAVLTTEVAPFAHGAVRELDVARRLAHYAVNQRSIPKGVDDRLLTVKDPRVLTYSQDELHALQHTITDANFRIFADAEGITVLNASSFVRDTDIGRIFDQLGVTEPSHAFYLGAELARAQLAMQLGKTYTQDAPLSWGYLTPSAAPRRHVRLTQAVRDRST